MKRLGRIGMILILITVGPAVLVGEIEISPFAGFRIGGQFTTDTTPSVNLNLEDSLTYGISLGYNVNPFFHLEFMWSRQDTRLYAVGFDLWDMYVDQYHFNFLYVFNHPRDRIRPYILGGLGWTYFNPRANVNGTSRFSFSFGGGAKIYMARMLGIRLQVKYTPTYITSDDYLVCDPWYGCFYMPHGRYINQWEFTGGLIFRFGR
jgi:hypothetical protein